MRNCSWALSSATIAFATLLSAHAGATEVLNLSAAAGTPTTDPTASCYSAVAGMVTATDPNSACEVYIALPVSAGRVVKQISIMHDDNQNYIDPHIDAHLDLRPMSPPYIYQTKFNWVSTTSVPGGTLATSKIMAQAGKLYPDAFVVDTNMIYAVVVHLYHGATVYGVQVVYE